MLLGFLVYIFAILGIYGFFTENLVLTYIGLVLCIIETIIGITSGQQKGFSTEVLTFWCAVGMYIGGNEFLPSLAICFCFENVILFSIGLLLLIITGGFMIKKEKEEQLMQENLEYEEKFFEELKRKNEEYDKEKNESR